MSDEHEVQIKVYLDNGLVYKYKVDGCSTAREHAVAITQTGYRSCDNKSGTLECFPAHRISKVKIISEKLRTNYPDEIEGT